MKTVKSFAAAAVVVHAVQRFSFRIKSITRFLKRLCFYIPKIQQVKGTWADVYFFFFIFFCRFVFLFFCYTLRFLFFVFTLVFCFVCCTLFFYSFYNLLSFLLTNNSFKINFFGKPGEWTDIKENQRHPN